MRIGSTDQAALPDLSPPINCKYLKESKLLTFFLVLLFIITAGLFYLPYRWFITVKTWFYFKSAPENSTHVLVSRKDSPSRICAISDREVYQQALNHENSTDRAKYRVINYNFEDFYYDYEIGVFVTLRFNTSLYFTQFHEMKTGIMNKKMVRHRKKIFGKAVIDVPVPSWLELYVSEVLKPFFVFQIFSIILWNCEEYYWYALCIFVIMVITLTVNVRYIKSNLTSIRGLATQAFDVDVLRNDVRGTINSSDLVPGDVIFIQKNKFLPCDSILLSGFALMDETMLTGESQPVLKECLPEINSKYNQEKLYTLSAGTKVVTSGGGNNSDPVAVITSIGFNTAKGDLVRSILFPKPNRFKFERDGLIFVLLMFLMALFGFCIAIRPLITGGYLAGDFIIKLLDLVTIAVPPALPLTMSIGIGYSLGRLKDNKITCISQPAINASGRVSIICFDKTGTLTTEFMKLKGVFEYDLGANVENFEKLNLNVQKCLSACHSLTLYENQFLGDPQEIAMLEAVGWNCKLMENGKLSVSDPEGKHNIHSKFTYHFSPEIKRMGVVVEENGKHCLFMKGAPEVILPLCRDVPNEMYETFVNLTREGYRVLACGFKKLENFDENDPLETVEKDLLLIGLPYLENPLKDDSIKTIDELLEAKIHCVISTGDNVLTGLSVGRAIGVVISKDVYLGDFIGDEIIWEDSEGKRVTNLPTNSDYEVVISGNLLEKILTEFNDHLDLIQNKCRVFGRMAPKHKVMLVNFFQKDEIMVAMVGDGANDCGALKKADVGLSLSKAEASIAAPFSCEEISSIIYILREGRCSLATSFQCFKFMMLYSVIQFTNAVMLYWLQTNLTNNQYIYQDFFNVMPMIFTVAASLPYHRLSKRLPPGSLISVPIIVSVVGVIILAIGFILSAYLLMDPCYSWYTEGDNEDFDAYDWSDSGYIGDTGSDSLGDTVKSSIAAPLATLYGNVIFMQGTIQLVVICTVFSIGKPFREPIYKNLSYMICLVILMAFNMYFLFGREEFPYLFIDLYQDTHMDYRWMMFGIFCVGSVITYCYEKFIVPLLIKCIRRICNRRAQNRLD